ncbi:MAG: hypothetical protein OXU20_03170 [Myxococcales bacterium]|nr:hypothetical protein [Myxococcales bacterium]MDD9967618.1 hypothetical protein [Myxococcales bacterium]
MDHRGLDHLPDEVVGEDATTRRHAAEPPDRGRRSPLVRLTLWFFLPALVAGGLLLYGVHLGAQHPDAWYTRTVTWIVELL